MRFFCRVTAGLEDIVSFDLKDRFKNVVIHKVGWRQIEFSIKENLSPLCTLPTVDDVYLYISELNDVYHKRNELDRIKTFVQGLKYSNYIDKLELFRTIPKNKHFYVTVSRVGKHNYTSTEIQHLIANEIESSTGWKSVDNFHSAELNFRVIIEHDTVLIGLSIMKYPLHKRDYKICHMPGSLKPPVAHLICKIIGCNEQDRIIDPMCGTGTILIEAKRLNPGLTAFGSDKSFAAIECAKKNWRKEFSIGNENLFVADIYSYPIQRNLATKIISNIPWGRQVELKSSISLDDIYLKVVQRLGAKSFICATLTDRPQDLLGALHRNPSMNLLWGRQISLFGSYPFLCILGGPEWLGKEKHAFNHISPIGKDIDALIENRGRWQPYSIS